MKRRSILTFLLFAMGPVLIPCHSVLASQMVFQTEGASSNSTKVGGIIWENTTWTLENSPYIITDTVQIPENVTLTIEPGVAVIRPTPGDMFLLHGRIEAHGTVVNKIVFDGWDYSNFFSPKKSVATTFLNLSYCIIRNGLSLWPPTGHSQHGSFSIRFSELINITSYSFVWYPKRDVHIEYNTFINSAGFSVGHDGPSVYIRYNLFRGNRGFVVQNWASYAGQTIVKYNSFIDMSGIVLKLPPGYDSVAMTTTENYWGTNDTDIIDSTIYDRKDDLTCAGYIDYLPILSEPHPDTPKISSSISCSISQPDLTLGDAIAVSGYINPKVSDANVTLTYIKPDSSILNRSVTSVSGGSYNDIFNPDSIGSWSVKASWMGDLIHEGASSSPVFFYVRPYLEVRCVDGDNESLSSLTAKIHNSTGHLIQTGITNSTGWVKYTGLLPDNYTLTAHWYSVEVANYNIEVTSATVVDPLQCGVYDYYVNVIDGDNENVENANVKLYFANETYFLSSLTNLSGWAEFVNLANTTYSIRTFCRGIQVSNLVDTLSVQGQIRIVNARIFDIIVHVVNEKGDDLANTHLTLSWLNGTEIGSKSTDSTGYVVFQNLPGTTYSIKATLEGYKDQTVETILTSEDQIETMTLQPIPFIETPTGMATIAGVVIAGIAITVIALIKRGIIRR